MKIKIFLFAFFFLSIESCSYSLESYHTEDVKASFEWEKVRGVEVLVKGIDKSDETLSLSEKIQVTTYSNFCHKLKNYDYKKIVACDIFEHFFRSGQIPLYKGRDEGFKVIFTVDVITPARGAFDHIWSSLNFVTLATVPYWKSTAYTVQIKVLDEKGAVKFSQIHSSAVIKTTRFLPLIFRMPLFGSKSSITYQRRHNLFIKKISENID